MGEAAIIAGRPANPPFPGSIHRNLQRARRTLLGRLGDVLTATCTEQNKAGRTGVYDIEVVNQRGERIALFRGRSYTMKGKPVVAL